MSEKKEKKVHVYGLVEKLYGSPVAEVEIDGNLRIPARRIPVDEAAAVINALLRLLNRHDVASFNMTAMRVDAELARIKRQNVKEATPEQPSSFVLGLAEVAKESTPVAVAPAPKSAAKGK